MKKQLLIKAKTEKVIEASLRILDKNNKMIAYRSTRLGDLHFSDGGFTTVYSDYLSGHKFELKDVSTKKVLAEGVITKDHLIDLTKADKSEAKVDNAQEKKSKDNSKQ